MGTRASKLSRMVGGHGVKRLRGPSVTLTPRGYVPVSVGTKNESKRFMIHTTAFGDADFLELLCRSAEEYGFYNEGVLRIPCESKAFEEWLVKGGKQKMLRVRPI